MTLFDKAKEKLQERIADLVIGFFLGSFETIDV